MTSISKYLTMISKAQPIDNPYEIKQSQSSYWRSVLLTFQMNSTRKLASELRRFDSSAAVSMAEPGPVFGSMSP